MYLKLSAGDGKFTVIPLTDENVFSICPVCGEEHQLSDIGDLITLPEFAYSRRVCCPACTGVIHSKGLDALMDERKNDLSNTLEGM